jgi:hypothetical protein
MTARSVRKILLVLLFTGVTAVGAGVSGAQVTTTAPPQLECTLSISPDPIPVGALVTVTASGFEPGFSVNMMYTATSYPGSPYSSVPLPAVIADSAGVVSASFVPDPPVVDGDFFFVFVADLAYFCESQVRVVAAPPATTEPPATALPEAVTAGPTFTG